MIVQADKADLAPAAMYLLFDAEDCRQNKDKEHVFNFADGQGMVNRALEVVLGGFPFTALGHETETRWTRSTAFPRWKPSGGPAACASPNAFSPWPANAFVRRIELSSVNLAGREK